MYNGRQEDEWGRLSTLLALVANVHPRKGAALKPADFNPFHREELVELNDDTFAEFRRQIGG